MEKTILISLEIEDLQSLIVDCVNSCLRHNQQKKEPQLEQLFTVRETADFLNLTVPTIYSKVSKGELPFMKRSKRLYFSSIELMEYIKEGRKKTNAEIESEAEEYLSNKKSAAL